eukprot:TRINITY_DN65040_c0_g1_i1.p1 TRINITY_DN65040_c0_g1~~TRINITY_DN65040_c0_g1_i1.p1  ORF type:complete len:326 (-),score=55.01 TRINITY_DN65040_c0_g1_i1:672-1577(-)
MAVSIFMKTRKCRFFGAGSCAKGVECRFAHSDAELRSHPDMRFTKMCPAMISGSTCGNAACTFAHSVAERRKAGFARSIKSETAPPAPLPPVPDAQVVAIPSVCDNGSKSSEGVSQTCQQSQVRRRKRGCRGGRNLNRERSLRAGNFSSAERRASSVSEEQSGNGNADAASVHGEHAESTSVSASRDSDGKTTPATSIGSSSLWQGCSCYTVIVKNTFLTLQEEEPTPLLSRTLQRSRSAPCLMSAQHAEEVPLAMMLVKEMIFDRGTTTSTEAESFMRSVSGCSLSSSEALFADFSSDDP